MHETRECDYHSRNISVIISATDILQRLTKACVEIFQKIHIRENRRDNQE
jgi:hypothetical protein